MSFKHTIKGDDQIPASELILPDRAIKIAGELTAAAGGRITYSVVEWVDANKDESIVYTDEGRILQIQPGDQDAAELRNAQDANPNGVWDVTDLIHVKWNPDMTGVNVNPPDAGSAANSGALGTALNQAGTNALSMEEKIDAIYNKIVRGK